MPREDETTPLVSAPPPTTTTTRRTRVLGAAVLGSCVLALAGAHRVGAFGAAPTTTPFRRTLATREEIASTGASAVKRARAIEHHPREHVALGESIASALGYPKPILPTGNAPMVNYFLHLGCEDDIVKQRSGDFWNYEITEARLVYHNYESAGFFKWEKGIPMTKSNIYPGDSQTWSVDTNVPDWEYGFALMNARGEILYEIGDNTMGDDAPSEIAPLFQQKECTNEYGRHHNRMAPIDVARSERPGYVDATFGSCKRDCVLKGDPWEWSEADQERMTLVMERNPPKGVGSSFIMYGTNSPGMCTMNLYADAACGIATDDILMHQDPRPTQSKIIFDFMTCNRWTGDYSGWRTQSWSAIPELGPASENGNPAEYKWKYTYEYKTNGLQVEVESAKTPKRFLILAPWLTSNPYDRVKSIGMWWNPHFHTKSSGKCRLAPLHNQRLARERVPV